MVDAYLASGLSAPRFAALHGVNYQTLVYWIKKSKTGEPADLPQSLHRVLSTLVPAEITPPNLSRPDDAIEVLLLGGTRILISSPGPLDLAVVLIRELQNSRPWAMLSFSGSLKVFVAARAMRHAPKFQWSS